MAGLSGRCLATGRSSSCDLPFSSPSSPARSPSQPSQRRQGVSPAPVPGHGFMVEMGLWVYDGILMQSLQEVRYKIKSLPRCRQGQELWTPPLYSTPSQSLLSTPGQAGREGAEEPEKGGHTGLGESCLPVPPKEQEQLNPCPCLHHPGSNISSKVLSLFPTSPHASLGTCCSEGLSLLLRCQ